MEYCEKQTLRQLIDLGELHRSEDRVWRLFREIVEGLEHIHSKVNRGVERREERGGEERRGKGRGGEGEREGGEARRGKGRGGEGRGGEGGREGGEERGGEGRRKESFC